MKYKLTIIAALMLVVLSVAVSAVTVTNSPSSCVNGTKNSNCANAKADDTNSATLEKNDDLATWSPYGFALPSDAVISSVIVRADAYASTVGPGAGDRSLSVLINHSGTATDPLSTATLGASESSYNLNFTSKAIWTPSIINSADFKVQAQCSGTGGNTNCNLDWIPVTVTYTYCGDGITNNAEACDDGANNGVACAPAYNSSCDYCSGTCTGLTAVGSYCGDNSTQAANGEQCDDGNSVNGDGCSILCATENNVPEFSTIAAGLALTGLGVGYMLIRRNRK